MSPISRSRYLELQARLDRACEEIKSTHMSVLSHPAYVWTVDDIIDRYKRSSVRWPDKTKDANAGHPAGNRPTNRVG